MFSRFGPYMEIPVNFYVVLHIFKIQGFLDRKARSCIRRHQDINSLSSVGVIVWSWLTRRLSYVLYLLLLLPHSELYRYFNTAQVYHVTIKGTPL